jgi:sugar O-acyltransferase (sialic acid O-acetyltransferase NeuD family)
MEYKRMKKPLYIYGTGGLGREVATIINVLPEWELVGFIDDSANAGAVIRGIPVVGGCSFLNQSKEKINVVIAIGDPITKEQIRKSIDKDKVQFATIVHPSVILQDLSSIKIGIGSILCAGSVLTCDIVIGEHVLINLNSTIGHDCSVGDFSSLMPGVNISGNVSIATKVLIGSGSSVRNKVTIKDSAIVGMGSVVIRNVGNGSTVAGVPAKPLVHG